MSNAIAKAKENKPDLYSKNRIYAKINNNASKELFYKNAIAIFGLVPMFALLTEYHKRENLHEVGIIKAVIFDFKNDEKFRRITQSNYSMFTNKSIVGNDIKLIDIALLDLGYYEKYNMANLESDMIEIIRFVNEGLGI